MAATWTYGKRCVIICDENRLNNPLMQSRQSRGPRYLLLGKVSYNINRKKRKHPQIGTLILLVFHILSLYSHYTPQLLCHIKKESSVIASVDAKTERGSRAVAEKPRLLNRVLVYMIQTSDGLTIEVETEESEELTLDKGDGQSIEKPLVEGITVLDRERPDIMCCFCKKVIEGGKLKRLMFTQKKIHEELAAILKKTKQEQNKWVDEITLKEFTCTI
ncbi:hypothetical protein KUTeg_000014 [Tegillarca granosa]|uniref:Uncharacterized protein n=1 Tax=Tegillarca granosa TaxID=220873 RepID=A0ABQ9G368_TEGGR|nr:hypothetical protein KUTeg_000014 [Tegillarca granosa]